MPADLSRTATLASMVRLSGADLGALEAPGFEPTTDPTALAGRNGYQPAFLDGWEIPLPLGIGPAAKTVGNTSCSGASRRDHEFSVRP